MGGRPVLNSDRHLLLTAWGKWPKLFASVFMGLNGNTNSFKLQ